MRFGLGVVFLFFGVVAVVFPELFVVFFAFALGVVVGFFVAVFLAVGFFAGVDDFFFGGIMFADFSHDWFFVFW